MRDNALEPAVAPGLSGRSTAWPAAVILVCLLLAGSLLLLAPAAGAALPAPPGEPQAAGQALTDRQRYGFVVLSSQWPNRFDVAQLGAGWYADYTQPICRVSPNGMDRVLGIKVGGGALPANLAQLVDNHPGTTWLIGNEPDCVWQDSLSPPQYARVYHDAYEFIKARDPTALVAAGNIVQATPARMAWLDAVLQTYVVSFTQAMPVDVWAVHNQILNELREYGQGDAGCDMPPGIDDPSLGVVRLIQDNDRLDLFIQQITDFRQWMADRGYGGLPLLITEYGVLLPAEYGFDAPRVNAFMSATFQWLSTAAGPNGDPADGDRLVQRWAWYSLDDRMWDGDHPELGGFNGNLFDPDTYQITVFGQNFGEHTAGLAPLSYVELAPGGQRVVPAPILPGPTGTLTVPLQIEVRNSGSLAAGPFSVTLAYEGPSGGTAVQGVDGLGPGVSRWLDVILPDLRVGGYRFTGQLDAGRVVAESTECNNRLAGGWVVPTHRLDVPLVARRNAAGARRVAFPAEGLSPAGRQHTASAAIPAGLDPRFREWPVLNPGSYPAQIAVDPADGTIWFTGWLSGQIVQFDPAAEEFVAFPITPTVDSRPWGLALDATGGVWFAEGAGNKIGRLDPEGGTMVEYEVPTLGSEPYDVAVDSTGIVWFSERAGNKIGRLDPATGQINEYAMLPSAQPTGLAVQVTPSLGTWVWFTESATNRLGRLKCIGTACTLSQPSVPTPNSAPQDVALTSFGYPWLTESQGNKLALFFPGTIADFDEVEVPTEASEPFAIAMDVDGQSVWFTERTAGQLGWYGAIGGDERFKEYRLPVAGSLPTGVAVDDSGCAWYTAPGADRIGRFCPATTAVHLPVVLKRFAAPGRE